MKEGWEIKEFDACIEKVKVEAKLPSSMYQESGKYPIVSQEKDLISGYWDKVEDLFTHTTPAVVFGDHTMVVKYVDFDFVVGADGVKVLVPKPFLFPKFFYYWISSVHIQGRGYARHYRYLRENAIPVPPLPEQQRIVDILDAEFEKIDDLRSNAELNLRHAKDLFQAVLKRKFQPKAEWGKSTISAVCSIFGRIGFRGYTKADLVASPKDGAITLSPSNIVDCEMSFEKCSYISWHKYEESPEIMIYNGDILLVKTGSSYGKCAIVEDLPHQATINPQFVVLKNIRIERRFLWYYLCSPFSRTCYDEFVSGAAIPTFSQKNLGMMHIFLPSAEEQQSIVATLDELNAKCKVLQDNYTKTIALCDDLKQSLLRKAFNGEL